MGVLGMSHGLGDYPCPRDDCDRAYPHPLLTDYHIIVDHGLNLGGEA